jgi:hypothetical protein
MLNLPYTTHINIYEENDENKSLQILEQLAQLGNISLDDGNKSNHTSGN